MRASLSLHAAALAVILAWSAPAGASAKVDLAAFRPAGDGKADDIAAFERAFAGLAKGGVLRIPAGHYRITRPLRFGQSHIRLAAEEGACILPQGCDGIDFGGERDKRAEGVILENLVVDMQNAPGRTGIVGHNADEVSFRDVEISKGAIGIRLDYCYNATLENVRCGYQSSAALVLEGADKTLINRGQYGTGVKGIVIQGGKAITLIGVSIERNDGAAIEIAAYSGRGQEYPDGVNIIGCYLEMNCQAKGGAAFVHVGVPDTSVSEMARGINFIGNFFNWGVPNRRTVDNSQPDSVPYLLLDQCGVVNLLGNRYSNGSNYAKATALADAKRIQCLNDPAASALKGAGGTLKAQGEQFLLPFQVKIDVDGQGYGESRIDLAAHGFTKAVATGSTDKPEKPGQYLEIDASNPGSTVLRVRRALPGKSVGVSGIIVGKWE